MKNFTGFFRSLLPRSEPTIEPALKCDDFPLTAEGTKLVKPDGETVAQAKNAATATEIVDRLNSDEERTEVDRWSA